MDIARGAGFDPDPWQADVLRSTAPRILLNCCRQSGKSTTVALLAAHMALYVEESLTLIVSPTERQSAETLLKVRGVLATAVGWPLTAEADGVTHLELANASRVIALSGQREGSLRGYSGANLVIFDEAARCVDVLYFAVSPVVAVSGGRIVLLSTPFGRRGFFSDLWHGTEPWQRVVITADACARIPRAFLEEQRRVMGTGWYEQEFYCTFMESQTAAFREEDIDAAIRHYEMWGIEGPAPAAAPAAPSSSAPPTSPTSQPQPTQPLMSMPPDRALPMLVGSTQQQADDFWRRHTGSGYSSGAR
jgi:hypothetical protein